MDQYFMALLPPEIIREQIRGLKEEIKDKYRSERALRLPAHITLQPPFKLTQEQRPHLLKVLEEFAATQSPFNVDLSGFGAFPPRVVFIEIANPGPVKHLHKALQEVMRQIISEEKNKRDREIHPHITLATRDLSRTNFKQAWEEFKKREFSTSFKTNSLVLFRHNGKTWDIIREFKFGK